MATFHEDLCVGVTKATYSVHFPSDQGWQKRKRLQQDPGGGSVIWAQGSGRTILAILGYEISLQPQRGMNTHPQVWRLQPGLLYPWPHNHRCCSYPHVYSFDAYLYLSSWEITRLNTNMTDGKKSLLGLKGFRSCCGMCHNLKMYNLKGPFSLLSPEDA